jgi:putative addiction module killer protein
VYVVKTLPEFDAWLKDLSDKTAQRRLVARLRKASLGNLGEVKPVGKDVVEMREHFGPGWRMYFTLRGAQLVVMLGGGAKSSQRTDIIAAQRRAALIEEE